MIEEKTPKYIVELKSDLIKHFDERLEKEIGSVEEGIESLAASTAREFSSIHTKLKEHDERFDKVDEKIRGIEFSVDAIDNRLYRIDEKLEKIEGHIGRYEIRAQNIEQILLKDHKPRIIELERKFA